jgi:hypothetical protein
VDGSLFWSCTDASTPRNWTDVELSRINDQGVWKFEAYTNWNDANPTATTFRRTLRRAPTLAEITASLPAWPSLTTAMRDQLVTSSASTGGMALSYDAPGKFNVSTTAGGNAWQIPATPKWTPNSVKIYGRDTLNNNAGFDDGVDVFSSWRKAVIGCSSAAGDMHCEGSTGSAAVSNGNFRAFDKTQTKGAAFGTLQFNGSDARRVQNTLTINLRKS